MGQLWVGVLRRRPEVLKWLLLVQRLLLIWGPLLVQKVLRKLLENDVALRTLIF